MSTPTDNRPYHEKRDDPAHPTQKQIASALGIAGDDFYNAAASRGVPSTLTLAMAQALLAKFDVRIRQDLCAKCENPITYGFCYDNGGMGHAGGIYDRDCPLLAKLKAARR